MFGSGLIIAAYFTILYLDITIGAIVHVIAISISLPYFIKSKTWDVVVMFSFLASLGVSRLITSGVF
ncbi:hypothetical protein CREGCYN_05160 [Synechococcus sp. M16CYN]